MDSLPFILAQNETDLEIIAVEKRDQKTDYNSLILVAKNSPYKSLKDLKGKKIAFSSQTSTSGYLFPYAELLKTKTVLKPEDLKSYFSDIVYAGGYDKAMLALSSQQTDAAALSDYAFEGPKADLYGTDLIRKDLRILTKIPGVPTHLIAVSKKVPENIRQKIQTAIFELAKEKPELLSSVYGAAELVKPTKNHVQRTQEALKLTGLEPKSFVK
jgi:phosphonate transport system substrate-binding protein